MDDTLPNAIALHRAGRLDEAEALYRQVLARDESVGVCAEATQLLGLIACQRGRLEDAVEMIGRAVEMVPANSEYWLNLGEVQRRRGKVEESIAALRRGVELAPQNAYGHYNLGVALRGAEKRRDAASTLEAIACFRRAVELAPSMAEGWNNLGLMLVEASAGEGDAATEAVACYERLRALKPGHAEVENNFGRALWEAGRHEEAVAAFERAVALKGDFAAFQVNLGTALRKLGRRAEAVAAYRRAAALVPESAEVLRDLGIALMELGQLEEAEETCRRGVAAAPISAEAHKALGVVLGSRKKREAACAAYEEALRLKAAAGETAEDWAFELAALRGDARVGAPEAFVRGLFDGYAARFEAHLVGELQYQVPGDLVALVLEVGGLLGGVRGWDVMDLGCGTGLCGVACRTYSRRVVGVDLAPRMVAKSRAREGYVYDEVLQGDMVAVLQRAEHHRAFDVLLAADAFIYIGELHALFQAAAVALRPGGVLAFSLERHDGEGFVLHERARFAHSLGYVRAEAALAGLEEVAVREAILRADIPRGWLMVLRRPAEQ